MKRVAYNLLNHQVECGFQQCYQEGKRFMQSNWFKLGFVHLEDLIVHEICDFNRVRRLADQIRKDGHLKNPILVSTYPAENKRDNFPSDEREKLLVLDGVNQVSALKLLGYPDILVQRVDYSDPNVELTSWDHLIFKIAKDKLMERLKSENLEIVPYDAEYIKADVGMRQLVHNGGQSDVDENLVGLILFRDRSTLVIRQEDSSPERKVKHLFHIIAIYNASWEIYPHLGGDSVTSAFDTLENCSAVNIIPPFRKEEIKEFSSRGILLPFGVTRFVIPQRILGLEISGSVLGANAPLSEKNLFLKELLSYRVKSKKTKFYQGPVFLFNE